MPLTDTTIRNIKPREKPYKLTDSKGLFLLIKPTGSKYWRFKYRFNGKEKLLSIGVYPDVTLANAREKRDEARKLLIADTDPSEHYKAIKSSRAENSANSFEVIAREWHAKNTHIWTASHADKIIRCLELNIFPWLGTKPIANITSPELLSALRRIEDRGALDTAHRAQQHCSRIFRYAKASGIASCNPAPDLQGALKPIKTSHFAAIADPKEVAGLLRAIDSYQGTFITKCALQLAPLVFVRPGELRKAEWCETDLNKAEWIIPPERMKMREPLVVPLPRQAVAILRALYPLTGNSPFIFPGLRNNRRPMSDNAILAALRRMGFGKDEMTGHGFRAMARTVLDEVLGIRPDYIELQLAHTVRDPNGRAYNRTAHLAERRKMMQMWADYLEELKTHKISD